MPGTELRAGDRVETAEGRLALRLEGGASVRLDRATRLVLNSTSVLELEAGAIYIDTGIDGVGGLEVRTDYGVARDIGTQFETRLGEGRLSLVVREGEVLFMGEGGEYRAGAGVALSLGPDGGVTRERVEASDPRWSWASAAAPPFDIEGRSLAEVLTWVARETGWTVRYEDAELERSAAQMLTHGSTGGLEPELVPDLVVPVAGLEHQLQGSVLRVERP
jgi:ferric-dicitrate binding protein FerR (iron transport regulator)